MNTQQPTETGIRLIQDLEAYYALQLQQKRLVQQNPLLAAIVSDSREHEFSFLEQMKCLTRTPPESS